LHHARAVIREEVSKLNNKYELGVIFKPEINDGDLDLELDTISDLIQKFNGCVEKIDRNGKRKLAYEIKKIAEGIYNFIYFTGDANLPKELESRMRIKENVLRYMIFKQ